MNDKTKLNPAKLLPQKAKLNTRSIGFRLPILIMSLVALSLLGSTVFSALQSNRILTAQANERFARQAEGLSNEIRFYLEGSLEALQALAVSERIIESLENNKYLTAEGTPLTQEQILAQIQNLDTQWRNAGDNDPLIARTIADSEETNVLAHQLYNFSEALPDHIEIFVTDSYGATLASNSRLSDYYQADEDWWQSAYNSGQGNIYISDIEFDDSAQANSIQMAIPVRDDESGNIVGIIRTTLDATALQGVIDDQSFGQTGHAELFTSTGEEQLDGRSESTVGTGELPAATVQSFVSTDTGTSIATDEAGKSLFYSFSRVKVTDTSPNWILLIRQDTFEALQAARQSLRNGLLAMLIALAASAALAYLLSRSITRPLAELSSVATSLGQGNLSVVSNVKSNDELGLLSQALNNSIVQLRDANQRQEVEIERGKQLQTNIGNFLETAMDIAQGDLTKRGKVSEDALGNVVDAINLMVEEIGYTLKDAQQATQSVNKGAGDMFATADLIAQSAQHQSREAQKARVEVEGISNSIAQMAQTATTSADAAERTLKASQEGRQAVTETLEGMQDIRREVQAISKRIKSLGDRSLEISEIVDTISRISRQTNLLALNAAIEASGAGEAGSRFAVVADEVRKLAEDSAQSTQRVSSLIKAIQTEVQEVVVSVESGTKEVEAGYKVATQAGQRLEEISTIAQQTAEFAQIISRITTEQVDRVEQVGQVVEQMAEISAKSQDNVIQGRETAEQLQTLASRLSENIARFRVA